MKVCVLGTGVMGSGIVSLFCKSENVRAGLLGRKIKVGFYGY